MKNLSTALALFASLSACAQDSTPAYNGALYDGTLDTVTIDYSAFLDKVKEQCPTTTIDYDSREDYYITVVVNGQWLDFSCADSDLL